MTVEQGVSKLVKRGEEVYTNNNRWFLNIFVVQNTDLIRMLVTTLPCNILGNIIIVVSSDLNRVVKMHGRKNTNCVYIESGRVIQNILTLACEFKLSCFLLDSFNSKRVKSTLRMVEYPVGIISIGDFYEARAV